MVKRSRASRTHRSKKKSVRRERFQKITPAKMKEKKMTFEEVEFPKTAEQPESESEAPAPLDDDDEQPATDSVDQA